MIGSLREFKYRLSMYIRLRRSLGCQFESQETILRAFERHVVYKSAPIPPDEGTVLEFATRNGDTTAREASKRYEIVRRCFDYLRVFDSHVPKLAPGRLRTAEHRPSPYIYSNEDLAMIVRKAVLSGPRRIDGMALRAAVGLAAGAGLRIGEVVGLDKGDVDLRRGILFIRLSKFRKDRLVPVHSTTLAVLKEYAASRDALGETRCLAFFLNTIGHRLSKTTLDKRFRALTTACGFRRRGGTRPTFHSLRHTFAVRRLVTWYEQDVDVQGMLPALATYMGHVGYEQTAYYLSATADLLAAASSRYEASLNRRRSSHE
jgi:integrase